ncbi:osmotically inducible protein OsmC [Marinilabiliaceae bacterium JC017]|nr:osmotically inducible protein OsmC [Marinilabiliaceae bacterium JC017]
MNKLIITLEEGKKVNAEYKGHVITTDQPQPTGENSAPAPFDLFLASIGTCAGIYVKSFCEQRGLSTDDIKIIQSMEYDPTKKLVSKINLDITVPASFPVKYKNALIKSAELCAVKRHLETPPQFNTTVSTT